MTNFATDDTSIMEKFPFEAARPGQVDTIRYVLNAFNNGKKFVIVEAPCGAGKSPIAMAVAGHFENAYYLTIQKILQDQLMGDFGEGSNLGELLVDLKGRGAYECPYYKLKAPEMRAKKVISLQQFQEYTEKYHSCAEGHCRRKGKYKYQECIDGNICPYYVQRDKAMDSRVCLMNFAGFLSQTNFTENFGHRKLMIIDEGHNIETQLLNFITLVIEGSDFPTFKLPKLESPEEYAEWFEQNEVVKQLELDKQNATFAEDPKRVEELEGLISKIAYFIKEMTAQGHDRWIHEMVISDKGQIKLIFKPIYVRKQAMDYLFDYADHVLILSATILSVNVMVRALGITRSDVAATKVKSTFPPENHPIIYRPVAKLTGGPKQQHVWGPAVIEAVDNICTFHKGQKGIIHTHNFKIAEMLLQDCDPEIAHRMIFQKKFRDKMEMLEYHAQSKDSIIVAPAMHEGLDLKDDLSRFQIICKMPFPNFFDDKQLEARKEDDEEFYSWLTALKLVQSVGRSVRSVTDWATTYIIDASFGWWYEQNKGMLPDWFKDSVIHE